MPIGNKMRVKVVKNKVAPPFRECEFENIYGHGINRDGEVVDLAVELDIVKKSGSWFSYNGIKIGQGRDSVKKKLEEDAAFRKEVEAKILEQIDKIDLAASDDEDDEAAEAAAEAAAETGEEPPAVSGAVSVSGSEDIAADDDFEEFDPTE